MSEYPVPLRSMRRLLKVATPRTAAAVTVPLSAPPPGFAPMASVMSPVKLVNVLPRLSLAVTCTAGTIAVPAVVAPGCTVKNSLGPPAGVMAKGMLVPGVRPPALATSV